MSPSPTVTGTTNTSVTWALDPRKNGGPFMDAMIHRIRIGLTRFFVSARYGKAA